MTNIMELLRIKHSTDHLEKNPDAISICWLALRVVRDAAAKTKHNISPGVFSIEYFQHFPKSLLPSRLQDIVDGLQFGHFNKQDRKTLEDFRESIEIILESRSGK